MKTFSNDPANRRVIFVNRFYYPDHGATAQILTDLTQHLSATGWDVHVITSRLSYSDKGTRYAPHEMLEGINISRVWTSGFGRAGILGRSIDYLSFYLSSFFSVLKHVDRRDIVVIKTDPPMLSVPLSLAAMLKRSRVINWLQDLFPEVAGELGVSLGRGMSGRALRFMRNVSLRHARSNVVIGKCMAERLQIEGVPLDRITIIHNFTDDTTISPDPPNWRSLRRDWGYAEENFVVGYSGNLGRAHDVSTILDAAERLKSRPEIKFLFVGGGHLRTAVETAARQRNLSNTKFQPYQPRAELASSLSVPDLHWISLLPKMEGLILPSKLYGIAAVGRPMIMIGDQDGDIGSTLTEYSFGTCVAIGKGETLAQEIVRLADNREDARIMGTAARDYLDRRATRSRAFSLWQDLLSDI